MSLFRPSELMKFLNEEGFAAKKSLSQNFLVDGNIIKKILAEAQVQKGDLIIEIGPGPGALTEALLNAGAHVVAIEKDRGFATSLSRLQTEDGRLQVFEEDCLQFPYEEFLAKKNTKAKVISNLPYHLTTPILSKLIPLHPVLSTLTLMVQKEVALRMCAKKGTPEYSSLSLFVQNFSEQKYCFTIEPTCFYPRPKVQSAIVQFVLKESKAQHLGLFPFIRTAFNKRRKMLSSSLKELFPKDAVKGALDKRNLNPSARPEELSLHEFIQLFEDLSLSQSQPL